MSLDENDGRCVLFFLPSCHCFAVTLGRFTHICRTRVCSDGSIYYRQFLKDVHVRILA